MGLYTWEGNYSVDEGEVRLEILLEVGYSWGDPDTGIGAGIEKINAFDHDGKEITLTEQQVEAIRADAVLAERIEDQAREDYEASMERRR